MRIAVATAIISPLVVMIGIGDQVFRPSFVLPTIEAIGASGYALVAHGSIILRTMQFR